MISYQEALNRCLEALAQGRDIEDVIASLPERYTAELRRDARLSAAMRRAAAAVPPPGAEAQRLAAARLQAELTTVRSTRNAPSGGLSAGFGLPRFAIAGFALAVLLVAVSFVLTTSDGNDGTVEAATLEGVVVANGAGSLTVQTLDTLEEVAVPAGADLADESGASLDLASIEVGQVVVVRANRAAGGPLQAFEVRRVLNGLPGWCTDAPDRCRQIARNLEDARERCRDNPRSCPILQDRIESLIRDLGDISDIEDLKQRCRESGESSCQDFIALCRLHPDVCIAPDPPGPIIDRIDDARQRLGGLQRLCAERDTRACRQIAQICESHPDLCPDAVPRSPQEQRSAPTATPQTQRPAPTPTPIRDQRPTR